MKIYFYFKNNRFKLTFLFIYKKIEKYLKNFKKNMN